MDLLSVLRQGEVVGERSQQHASGVAIPIGAQSANVIPVTAAPAPAPASQTVPAPILTPEPKVADGRLRVLLCGTYPIGQSNGYSRVVYYIAKHLGLKTDIKLSVYGFQNYSQTLGAEARNDISPAVTLHDALAYESPKRHGFGEKEIGTYLKARPQDIVIIFNDMVITGALVQTIQAELTPDERKGFKLVSYMDQVYAYQKKTYIDLLNSAFDAVVTFTPYWRDVAKSLGVTRPLYVFPHGFDPLLYFPIPRDLARMYYQIPNNAFVILNLNRNQPRKRWDHTMMAFADVIERHLALKERVAKSKDPNKVIRPVLLMVATQMDGFWNLMDILEHQLKLRGISMDVGKEYIVTLAKPQQMSDFEINVLYNACDVGLNTCEGEGFGLCQFEHAAIGCPQVVADLGGFKDFLHSGNSTLVDVKLRYYVDKQRDGIGGYAELSDPKDIAEGLWKYFSNSGLVTKHGARARTELLRNYRWETVVDYFHRVLKDIAGGLSAM